MYGKSKFGQKWHRINERWDSEKKKEIISLMCIPFMEDTEELIDDGRRFAYVGKFKNWTILGSLEGRPEIMENFCVRCNNIASQMLA